MNLSIHVAKAHMSKALATILSVFHLKKKQRGVDQMLLRLYEPILWRSLKVANPEGNVSNHIQILLI